ncbi:hypothetical protein MUN81_19475 [Hymenobacter sp. 5317J-9]|uniref:hypothetical protein n=1 Tax=Hymenobacter sp. 5317J-9 TaxID=2932250 RepID=UPI001FD6EEE1|nr:hypothetical protein [Hymenobacter sp. 5317J-9]UOQ97404.1 hypothetical protein MUN81_19475 [Hymenobacter sp. 5317J-9]
MSRFLSLLLAGAAAGACFGCSPKAGAALTADQLSAALPAGTPYAVVHFYRPGRMAGFAIGYDVRLNDSVVYRARNGSRLDLYRRPAGTVLLSAKTEARSEVSLAVEPGREYYVQCTIGMGALVGRPHLQQVSVTQGSKELAGISPSK